MNNLQISEDILFERISELIDLAPLKKCRYFYLTYRDNMIGSTVWTQLESNQNQDSVHSVDLFQSPTTHSVHYSNYKFTLSWSHYLVLMRIKNADERHFYEIECQKQDCPNKALLQSKVKQWIQEYEENKEEL